MRASVPTLVVLAIGLVLALPAAESQKVSPVVVSTHYGDFEFRLNVENDPSGPTKLKGDIRNFTTKNWSDLVFKVTYLDRSGHVVATTNDLLRVATLKKGESYSLGEGEPIVAVAADQQTSLSRVTVSLNGGTFVANYRFTLLRDVQGKSGMSKVVSSKTLESSDDITAFIFDVSKQAFGFTLTNKSNESLAIEWNAVVYIDVDGQSRKVMPTDRDYPEEGEPLSRTPIPPHGKIVESVLPLDYIRAEKRNGQWHELPLFPDGPDAEAVDGKVFEILIPVGTDRGVRSYSFKFKVTLKKESNFCGLCFN